MTRQCCRRGLVIVWVIFVVVLVLVVFFAFVKTIRVILLLYVCYQLRLMSTHLDRLVQFN